MKAVILCAGHGTRLGKLTREIPKPMIKVAGKPVLEHLIDHLNFYGIQEIIVNLHYLPKKIMEYFGTRLLYSYEPSLLGEEGTIDSLFPWLERDFAIIMNGDTLTNININKMFRMSRGKNIKFMDGNVYAGTRIIAPHYSFNKQKSFLYQDPDAFWIDIGTPSSLKEARGYYEKEISNLS